MYIESVPNRNSPPAILLREAYREDGKIKKRTLANLSKWPSQIVEGLRALLKGGTVAEKLEENFEIVRSMPYGHVGAILGTLRKLKLDRLIGNADENEQRLVLAMIVARIIDPCSKLATARGLGKETGWLGLAETLDISHVNENDLYNALDWLHKRQETIEKGLAKRHLSNGSLVLYDVTSTYFEGHTCPLAQWGHNRDKKKGKLQIVFGLLCTEEGCPIAVQVFSGETGDPATLGSQINKVRECFKLERVIWVGDRGILTEARIKKELKPCKGLDWITCLRAPQIRKLMESGSLQLSLFDDKDLGEIKDPAYAGERLIVCRNPFLAKERVGKRKSLMEATEGELAKIVQAVDRAKKPLRGKDKIALRIGRVLNHYKVGKYFKITIQEEKFSFEHNVERIEKDATLDGIYVIRTSTGPDILDTEKTVKAYKGLSVVERAFRSYKSVDLKVRPIFHYAPDRVRAHVFLCMLAYYVEWHMRRALAPILFDDDDPAAAQVQRKSMVAPAVRSASAKRKANTKRTPDGLPVHSFRTLLEDLATIAKNTVQPKCPGLLSFNKLTKATPVQQKAIDLLGVRL